MAAQLTIFEGTDRRPEWAIDDATRAAGRAGIAQARAALQDALEARRRREVVVPAPSRQAA
ncbi:MAG: hypothetical protein AB7L84_04495 [Acidimicrobiia bacterium]